MLGRLLSGLAALLALGPALSPAAAQSGQQVNPLPQGTITIVVPLAPGGPVDVVARLMADRIATRTSRNFIVENKAGAAGNIGSAAVARSQPNGATWLLTVDSVFTVNPHMYTSQGFDPDKDLTPVGQLGQVVLMLAVNAKSPARSWPSWKR